MSRQSIEIASFHHGNPIPAAARVGPLLASSVIAPRDPDSEHIPPEVDAQVSNLFHHMGEMLAAAGAEWRHVARITFFAADGSVREAINRPWLEHFPDAGSRPARHTQILPTAGRAVSCEFLAYVDD
jgi:2-iminobutanoate/2-iminopropanoate deaminase